MRQSSSPTSKKTVKRASTAKTTTVTTTEVRVTASANMSNTVFNNLMSEQKSNEQCKYEVQEGRNQIDHLKETLIALNGKLSVFDDVSKDLDKHKDLCKEHETKRGELNDHMQATAQKVLQDAAEHKTFQTTLINENDNLKKQMEEQKLEMNRQQQKHIDEQARQQQTHLSEKENQRVNFQSDVDKKDLMIKQYIQTVKNLESTVFSQTETISMLHDVEHQLNMERKHVSELQVRQTDLQTELTTVTTYMQQLEDKLSKQSQTSLELLKALKDSEHQVETLKQYVIDLKSRIAVYIPVKDDAIDKKLAEYINNYPDRQKLKIMFMRESEGVYQFGTKRVAVKVEKDKINIRVGGGYLSLDEFLDQYTPAELEKLERKDPLKRFSEKVAVQKTIIGKERVENSPVRQRKSSPVKV